MGDGFPGEHAPYNILVMFKCQHDHLQKLLCSRLWSSSSCCTSPSSYTTSSEKLNLLFHAEFIFLWPSLTPPPNMSAHTQSHFLSFQVTLAAGSVVALRAHISRTLTHFQGAGQTCPVIKKPCSLWNLNGRVTFRKNDVRWTCAIRILLLYRCAVN